jgi:sulfite reductase alpha subunit-like flavoprotein/hemoglobin-like flavoprotein
MVTALTVTGLTAAPERVFRCHIRSIAPNERSSVDQITQPRSQPDWLVHYAHPADEALVVVIQMRDGNGAWQPVGRVDVRPDQALGKEASVAAEYPLGNSDDFLVAIRQNSRGTAAADHPNVKTDDVCGARLQLRFSAERRPTGTVASIGLAGSAVVDRRPRPRADVGFVATSARPAKSDAGPGSYAAIPALTAQEEVIVKDTWNKLLAFHELLADLFFERLLHEEPDLIAKFDDAIDNLAEDFCGMFDAAVRQLQPHTEVVLRESYRGVPGHTAAGTRSVEGYAALFADLGMRPRHWLAARRVWLWMLGEIPYMEEYERENLALGEQSAFWRFFTRQILPPALAAIHDYDEALPPDVVADIMRCGDILAANAREVGTDFYRTLFEQHPEVLPYFGRTDMDALAGHLMNAIGFLVQAVGAGESILGDLKRLAAVHADFAVPPDAYPKMAGPMIEVLRRHIPDFSPALERGWMTLLSRVANVIKQPMVSRRRVLDQAAEYLDLIARELEWPAADKAKRWAEIENEVRATGTYTQTYEELAYGAQVAWRNSPKCVGRIAWRNMIVRDCRHVTDPDEMFHESVEHARMGVNGGNMQIVMNVFRPKRPKERWGPRFWNLQYFRYAAYGMPDGTVLGDKANLKLTKAILKLGWTPPEPRGEFDILPLVIEVPGQRPKIYNFDRADVMEVPIEHPTNPELAKLGLKWVVIPAIATFRLTLGGLNYACLPFNGWFMGTEIARNLFEESRYGKAEAIARAFGLDTSTEQTLWRDRAFLELNVAVLYSFGKHKVTIVDHQTASRQFLVHDQREKRAGREVPAQWSWVVPSAGGSATPVWHHEMRDFYLRPHYHYAGDKWSVVGSEQTETAALPVGAATQRVLILFGSETGTAEGYARQAARRLKRFRPRVLALDECEPETLSDGSLVLVVASTFGDGEMPGNAKQFHKRVRAMAGRPLDGMNFSVMALGSTVYPNFCAAGIAIDRELVRLGGNRVVGLHKGDEINGQADTFRKWLDLVARLLGEDPTAAAATGSDLWLRVTLVPPHSTSVRQGPGTVVPVVANRELLKNVIPGSRSTRFLAFDLAGTGLQYETGDHLAVHPRNPDALVERVASLVGIDPNAWFRTELADRQGNEAEGETPYPQPLPVRQALAEDLDLSLREPFTELIAVMHKAATAAADKQRLDAWVETLARGDGDADCAALKKYIADTYVNLAELLEDFPSAKLQFAQLVELLPRLKPRLYSISSSALVHPTRVHLTVGVVEVTTDAGRTRPGLCSNYLAGLNPAKGATVRVAVRTSNFRPPEDLSAPVLMVGPGTGLSPLVAFLQDREYRIEHARKAGKDIPVGDARLYFGCRDENDFLYEEDLRGWHRGGTLSFLGVAFSRLTEKKTYVQHLIAEHAAEVWEVLRRPDAKYYVCGDSKMADDVAEALLAAAKSHGRLTHAQAVDFFDRMRAEKRFYTDVWGVTFNFKQAIEQVREAKYSQAERWLERVTGAYSVRETL